MLRRLSLFLVGLLLAGVAMAAENDWLIVPGERVGPITSKTTRADLTKLFGAENLKDEKIHLVEGTYGPATWVYPKNVKKRLAIVWTDDSKKKIEFVRLTGSVSEWRTLDGITLGTRLTKLQVMNGKRFRFYGFSWDYGGSVTDWDGGKLGSEIALMPLRLSDETARRDALTEQQRESLMGDRELWSDNELVQKLDPWVWQMMVTFK